MPRVPLLLSALAMTATAAAAQDPAVSRRASDSLATLRVVATLDGAPLQAAIVRSGRHGARTDAAGVAVLRLAPGPHLVTVSRIGLAAETLHVALAAGADTTITVALGREEAHLEEIIVSATRGERRIEDEPVRVEVLVREEIEEKMLMTPGDIAMMLNETSGLRVQTTSPSLGGANVRIQGLSGRYTQVLADGLPLHGGQTGSLGLLQIPPMDLGRVEVIKGAASALYGAQALGGVINLVSRRPGEEREHELLLNRTTRGGTDGVLWLSGPAGEQWGWTLLAGAHGQDRQDVDDDGWADMPGYRRAVVRPRIVREAGDGRSLFLTAGATVEAREGGTIRGRATPAGDPHVEALETRRFDLGGTARWLRSSGVLISARASATDQRHEHRFGDVREDDVHRTVFAEATLAVPRGRATWILGAAYQLEDYASDQVPRFDYTYATPAAFVQADVEATSWLSLSASARVDAHGEFGAFFNPRVSVLLRPADGETPAAWSLRASAATGSFAPTPFTEETEVTGLTPLEALGDLEPERALGGSVDLMGEALGLELIATAFGSVVRDPIAVIDGAAPGTLRLVNAAEPTRTHGAELLARWRREPFSVTASYTYIRATELDPETDRRRDVTLVPRHALGIVGMHEVEDSGRIGAELYYTGRQALHENPYRSESRPYVIVGLLVERRVGRARLFLNAENLTDVRQTRTDPLLRPAPGPGGRWTTDAWTELAGRTLNGGLRWEF